jgi:hypothetical protein
MRRLVALACLTAPLVAAPAAAALERLPLQARLVSCTTGDTARERTAAFTASMRAIEGSARMWVRFDLFERAPGAAGFVRTALPTWGRWERSEPVRTGFIYTKRVMGLRAPAIYRARVLFRWYGLEGELLRRARRFTRACAQPDPRPDLKLGAVSASPGLAPGTATYLLAVVNRGRGPATAFDVQLTAAGMPQMPVRVDGLAPGETRVVSVTGPTCAAGSTVRFALDPGAEVDEADEGDDVADRPCPLA